MAAFCVIINTDGAAFHEDQLDEPEEADHSVVRSLELGRILVGLAERVDAGAAEGTLADVNGNTVGSFGPLESVITRAVAG